MIDQSAAQQTSVPDAKGAPSESRAELIEKGSDTSFTSKQIDDVAEQVARRTLKSEDQTDEANYLVESIISVSLRSA
jgi:uncharacterized protein YgbK (DUF1537 family)